MPTIGITALYQYAAAARTQEMPEMTMDELQELLTQLELSTEDSRDELLTDFLVRPYPTKVTQDN
jgi:hypothetical protein